MGDPAPEPCRTCFVEGPPMLGVVRCVDDQNFAFGQIVFFSERAFVIANKRESRADPCARSGQTWLVFSSEAKLAFGKPPKAREGSPPQSGKICVICPTK